MGFNHLALVFCFLPLICSSRQDNSSFVHQSPGELVEYIRNHYDKTMIPNRSVGAPLEVKIDIYVIAIEPIDRKRMRFTIQVYLRQYWNDATLRFKTSNTSCTDYVSLHPELISKVWVPDTYIENEVEKDVRSTALVIYNTGQILLSERLNIQTHCPLKLRRYPMDVQECTLKFQSYSNAACELQYSWFYKGQGKSLRLSKAIEMPNYYITGLETLTEIDNLKTGSFSRVLAKFRFQHKVMCVLMRDYLPAAFIVVTSWLSFYIDPAASPARVSLAVVTVLSISTQLSSTFKSTPEVSYIKAIDWYVIGCFLFVSAAMIEYGFIHRYEAAARSGTSKRPLAVVNHGMATEMFKNDETKPRSQVSVVSLNDEEQRDKVSRNHGSFSPNYSPRFDVSESHVSPNETKTKKKHFLGWSNFVQRPSSADAISRIVFPVLFLIFNAIYWFLLYLA